ncbi:cobalamin-dependent protein, partial [bacterium]|nr:cobalamin-dependent protein [bacterium]
MKVMISYPPLEEIEGTPLISQNRQYQAFRKPTYIYPMVPASAATLLKAAGYEVIWNDCIAEGWNYSKFLKFIQEEKPDLIAMETKTPVIKRHWRIINELNKLNELYEPITVLMGDHVTALPEESMQNSKVDYVLTGGDYDFLLLNLCNAINS